MAIDPITLEILHNRLREIAGTMEYRLFHSGYSTILRESYDGSAGLCDVDGSTVMASGSPYHLIAYSLSVRGVLQNYPLEVMRDGDSFILTDPYVGGNFHVPDLVVVTPLFVDAIAIGFCVSIAHKSDLGGLVPGSSGAGAREIFHEGLLLPGVKYWTKDGPVFEVEAIVKRNSRAPDAVIGDLRAQVGCTHTGIQLVRELAQQYGRETIVQSFRELQDLSERRVRKGLQAWPDGESEAEGLLDHDGVDLDVPLRMHVKVTKRGDRLTLDFSGMNRQVKGPVNLRPQHAQTAAVLATLTQLDPGIPINQGALRAIELVNPPGVLTNANWPAPVNSYYGMMYLVYAVLQKAFARFSPARAVGTLGFGAGVLAAGFQLANGKQSILYELLVTSMGGTPQHDGTFPVQSMSHASPNTPIEILESEFPLRVLRHEWITDRAGAGRYRGGPGYAKEFQILQDAAVTVRFGHHFKHPGWGVLGGGAPPVPNLMVLSPQGERKQGLQPLQTLPVAAGDILRFELPGGGGYGDPFTRSAEEVLEDVLNGYVSVEGAERDYGVALSHDGATLDLTRTAELRKGH